MWDWDGVFAYLVASCDKSRGCYGLSIEEGAKFKDGTVGKGWGEANLRRNILPQCRRRYRGYEFGISNDRRILWCRRNLGAAPIRIPAAVPSTGTAASGNLETHELLKTRLERLYSQYNERYLWSSMLGVVKKFQGQPRQAEVVGFLAACLDYGGVPQARRAVERLLAIVGEDPLGYIVNFGEEKRLKLRTFSYRYTKGPQLASLVQKMKEVISEYGSLEDLFSEGLSSDDEDITNALIHFTDRLRESFLVPSPRGGSACKRMCLFLRWMVRRGRLDLGLWNVSPALLVMPVDRHVARISYYIGLLDRLSVMPSWNDALKITRRLRELDPSDPVKYDFAISRLGILDACKGKGVQSICGRCPLGELCRFS